MDANSTCSLPSFNHLPPKKFPEFPSDYTFARTRNLPSSSITEHLNEKRECLPSLNSILHSTSLPELQNTSAPPPILIPKLQHTSVNHASTTQSPQVPIRDEFNSQGSNDDNIKHSSFPTQPNSYNPPPYSQPPNIRPSIWSRAGSPHSPLEQIQPYQQSLPPQVHHPHPPSHPYETNSSMRHTNSVSGYPYQNMDNMRSSGVQITEQSLAKVSKVVDYCSRISQHVSQYRDVQPFPNLWSTTPQISEAQLTDMINLTHNVLDILSDLKGELNSKATTGDIMNNYDFDLVRKTRTQRMKYRKRSKRAAPPGRCHSCNISETPEWRRGPDGARTLCNACGLHFAKMTRKRALMLMQQQFQHSTTTESSSSTRPDMSHSMSIYRNVGIHNLPLTTMPTPGASDAERDGPPNKRTRVGVQEELDKN